jgi:hypothetical protein
MPPADGRKYEGDATVPPRTWIADGTYESLPTVGWVVESGDVGLPGVCGGGGRERARHHGDEHGDGCGCRVGGHEHGRHIGMHGQGGHGEGFRRRFMSRADRITELEAYLGQIRAEPEAAEAYLKDLQTEATAVEERIGDMRSRPT